MHEPDYAWVVTADYTEGSSHGPEEVNDGWVDPIPTLVCGPSWATEERLWKALMVGTPFRCLDGDGVVNMIGRMWYNEDDCNEDDGNPLEDYAMPSHGCTDLEIWSKEKGWVSHLG